MNRDPENRDITKDPIFLVQVGVRQWTKMPDGIEHNGEGLVVDKEDELEDWIRPFITEEGWVDTTAEFWEMVEKLEGDHGWPLVYTEWRTETVFLTRDEAEAWAERRSYRWEKWKVYCVPCSGELATILNEYQPAAGSEKDKS